MSYKILSKRSSFLERAITFEVNGKLETISAPPQSATFDDLIQQIEDKYGEGKKAVVKAAPKAEEAKVEESESVPEKETKKATSTSAPRSRKKKSE